MLWLLALASVAHAMDTVRVLLTQEGSELTVADAWALQGVPPGSEPGRLQIADDEGRVLATRPLERPMERSAIAPAGGGDAVVDPARAFVIDAPLVAGATTVQLGTQRVAIRAALGPGAASAVLIQGDGGPGRQDLVVLSEGYTDAELPSFLADANDLVAYLGVVDPYAAYGELLNVWRVDVASLESGADHPSRNDYRNTAFDCFYECGGIDRLICCDGDVVGVATAAVPGSDGIVVLVNDPEYGGSGGAPYATSYNGDSMERVTVHEMGHSLVDLWDEYTYGYAFPVPKVAPNCSFDPINTPWEHWRDQPAVDAWLECTYDNYYRPTNTACLMRVLQDAFCPVCKEHVVKQIYSTIPTLFGSASPAPPGPVVILPASPQTFTVTTLGPDDDSETVTWTLDGQWVGAGPQLTIDPCVTSGSTLVARVEDPTPWVRNDPQDLLSDEVTWSITTVCPRITGLVP